MRLIKLVRTEAGRLAALVGAVRINDASTLRKILVYDAGEDAYVPSSPDAVARIPGFFGDGKDGVVRYTADTTLHADARATSIIVDSGVTVYQNGFELTATATITNNGTIHNDGASAVGDSRGIAHSVDCTAGMSSGDGGVTGSGGTPSRNSLVDTFAGAHITAEAIGAEGGDGGGPSGGPGGTNASNWTYDPAGNSPFSSLNCTDVAAIFCARWQNVFGVAVGAITVGSGGGGGTTDTGGAGGAGGSIVRIRAPRVTNNGLISARGGNGGGAIGPDSGGGGGGGGGRIVIVTSQFVQGTLDVSGGLGGAGTGTGTAGQPGAAGTIHIFGSG